MSVLSLILYGVPDLFVALFIFMPVMLAVPYTLELFFIHLAKFAMQWFKMTFNPETVAGKMFYCGTDAITMWVLLSYPVELGGAATGFAMLYLVRIFINFFGVNL